MRSNNRSPFGLRIKKCDCVVARRLFGIAKPRSSRLALALFYPQRKPEKISNRL